ncbi:MAG: type VI secretion system protein TssA [Methylococcaceae bacterium]|nr:type VI secretion system protein TssA [Methylococcaceae bacterium]
MLDFEKYLIDVDPDNVCGEDLQYDQAFIALEQAIKGKPEQQIGDTIQEAEPPNWREVRKDAEELLTRTRDLRVLISLLRALIALDGISGLSSGMALISELVEQRWDTIHPLLDPDDDNDPTERVNILMSLCDQESILRPLQLAPLVESKAIGKFNLRDIKIANGKITTSDNDNTPSLSTIEAAFQETDPDNIKRKFDDIVATLEKVNKLEHFVTERVGINEAPNFDELRNFLKDCKDTLATWVNGAGSFDYDDIAGESDHEEQTTEKSIIKKTASGEINSNQDVLNALKKICDYYRKNEPSSPIPILLERCARLVGKSFLEVLKDIAPDGVDQANVIMGIRENYE